MEHAHEQHERDFVSYMTDNYDPLLRSGQMKLLKGNAEIVPGHFGRRFIPDTHATCRR